MMTTRALAGTCRGDVICALPFPGSQASITPPTNGTQWRQPHHPEGYGSVMIARSYWETADAS
jgi:hypothetical protein